MNTKYILIINLLLLVACGTDKEEGTVDRGMKANLLVLDANPLQDITRTLGRAGVVHNGTWHDRAALDQMLQKLEVR